VKIADDRQRGVALVTTLLAVTLLTIAVVEFAYSSQVDYHLAHNALKTLQATYLARSGVNLAMLVLKRDGQTSSGIDTLSEEWARPLPPLPAGQGVVVVRVSDEQGKLNLNVLRNTSGTVNSAWREVAERVFALRGVDPGLLDPLVDWLDTDDFPEPRGAERGHYLTLTPPYTSSNSPLLTLGELGRIEGFTVTIRSRLNEVVTVLPSNSTQINVNTAPIEILAALFPAVERKTFDLFLASRGESPIHGVNDLRDRLGLDPRAATEVSRFVSVRSEFFAVTALATVEPVSQILTVIVQRRGTLLAPISWHPATPVAVKE